MLIEGDGSTLMHVQSIRARRFFGGTDLAAIGRGFALKGETVMNEGGLQKLLTDYERTGGSTV